MVAYTFVFAPARGPPLGPAAIDLLVTLHGRPFHLFGGREVAPRHLGLGDGLLTARPDLVSSRQGPSPPPRPLVGTPGGGNYRWHTAPDYPPPW